MRKLLACILALSLCFILSPAANAITAPENSYPVAHDVPSRDELLTMACDAFPEYAKKIRTVNESLLTTKGSDASNELVVSKKSSISDSETLTYYEYRSGLVFVTYDKLWTVTSTTTIQSLTIISGIYSVICNASLENFLLDNFCYAVDPVVNDYITNTGYDGNSSCTIVNKHEKLTQDAVSHAFVKYVVLFAPLPALEEAGMAPIGAQIQLDVGDEEFTPTVNGS